MAGFNKKNYAIRRERISEELSKELERLQQEWLKTTGVMLSRTDASHLLAKKLKKKNEKVFKV